MSSGNDNWLIDSRDLESAYSSGQILGALIDDPIMPATMRMDARRQRDEVLASANFPRFELDAPLSAITGSSKGQLCTPWHSYLKSDADAAMKGAQVTGDCVSWGVRTASDITRCWEIWMKADEQYVKRQATALIYSGRGYTGQGASPARLSDWHVKTGYLLEEEFVDANGKTWDFRDYESYVRLGMSYGRNGLPDSIISITEQHRLKQCSLVEDLDALADGLWNGYGAHCGSSIGVSSTGNPISVLRGSWSHDMAIVGFDDREETKQKFGSRIWFWDQSWGDWNRVSGQLPDWMPWGQGMFALTENSTWKAVRAGGTWVFSDSDGFPARPFDNLLI